VDLQRTKCHKQTSSARTSRTTVCLFVRPSIQVVGTLIVVASTAGDHNNLCLHLAESSDEYNHNFARLPIPLVVGGPGRALGSVFLSVSGQ